MDPARIKILLIECAPQFGCNLSRHLGLFGSALSLACLSWLLVGVPIDAPASSLR